ncbi:MAG: glycosyltransferase family 39 protein [Acetobacteraceae bacterium]
MVNLRLPSRVLAVLTFAVVVLTTAAWLRSPEYDEQYTLFLAGGTARPQWPEAPIQAAEVVALQAGHADLATVAADLRRVDVHPPLYFWTVSIWRACVGASLLAARLFSVLCGVAALVIVSAIAVRCGIRPIPAMLLTLGCYGFVYTSIIARGFALAQALTLGGVWMLTKRRTNTSLVAAGVLFGAATSCNYLSVFVGAALGLLVRDWRLLAGAAPFLALDGWFFAAQHGARHGQFPSFSLTAALTRLVAYQVAGLFGGLPLYADGVLRGAIAGGVGLLALCLLVAIVATRPWMAGPNLRLLTVAAIAPAVGLLSLGLAFNNTPIELRYLCFGLPYIALLAAWACQQHAAKPAWSRLFFAPMGRGRAAWPLALPYAVGAVQCAAIAGLVLAPATMQPARSAARAIAALGGKPDAATIVLLPRGNDGVGIVGAFGREVPATLRLLIISPTDTVLDIRSRTQPFSRVILALLGQDSDSRNCLPSMRRAFASPGWRLIAAGSNIEAYERE